MYFQESQTDLQALFHQPYLNPPNVALIAFFCFNS